jgi:hypothetical protein
MPASPFLILWPANCCFVHISLRFPFLLRFCDEQFGGSSHPFLATLVCLLGPGGVRSIVAESLLLKHQLLIVNRSRQRSPNLFAWDRILAGLRRLQKRPSAAVPFRVNSVGCQPVGGVLGAVLFLHTASHVFLTLAPWLLLFAVAVFTWSRSLAQFARRFEGSSSFGSAAAVLCQFAISVYGGYFGGGMGVLMLALFSAIRGNTFHSANGLRTICGSAINGVSVVIFLIHDAIDWRTGSLMMSFLQARAIGKGIFRSVMDRRRMYGAGASLCAKSCAFV